MGYNMHALHYPIKLAYCFYDKIIESICIYDEISEPINGVKKNK